MPKESPSLIANVCEKITNFCLYTAIFLTPIFFLPWTSDVLDFNKQTLLLILLFIALFAWMLKILASGKLRIILSKAHIAAGLLFLACVLSGIFSIYRYGSFWGWPLSSADSLLTIILVLVAYFLASNTFAKKDIFNSVVILSVSALIAQIIGVFQLSGVFIIPFGFAKSPAFNTIGSAGSLGIFSATLLPLAVIMLILSKKWLKILFVLQILFSSIILFQLNFFMVWLILVAGSALIMVFGVLKRNLFDGRWLALPMFFLAISLFFIFLHPSIPFLGQKVNEIYLTQSASIKIDLQGLKEKPVFGSGPGTFSYYFAKYKDPAVSGSSLWNISFTQSASKVLTDLASTGIAGLLALLAVMVLPIYCGLKYLIVEEVGPEKDQKKTYWGLVLGLTSSLAVLNIAYFLYNTNVTLSFIYFLLAGLLVGLVSVKKKDYELKSASLATLVITFTFTIAFIFGLGLLILDGQRYVAEVKYYKGVSILQSDADAGVKSIESAAGLNPSSDLYFRHLSQAYLAQLQQLLQNVKQPGDEQKAKMQGLLANSINAGKIASDINPQSAGNWSNRGYVYQSLYGLISDADKWALSSYDQALKLDPNNPYLYAQQGNVYYISKKYPEAKDKLEKSVSLNPNYSNGLYSLGLVYDALGQKDKAIEQFIKVQQLNPKDAGIQKILTNLRAGLPALQSPAPLNETPSSSAGTQAGSASAGLPPAEKQSAPPKK